MVGLEKYQKTTKELLGNIKNIGNTQLRTFIKSAKFTFEREPEGPKKRAAHYRLIRLSQVLDKRNRKN